jgi:hypothetical protein
VVNCMVMVEWLMEEVDLSDEVCLSWSWMRMRMVSNS